MGILFCKLDNKEPVKTATVSDSCVERLRNEEQNPTKPYPADELKIPRANDEKEWIMKLKCLDDAHSNMHDLTLQGFYKLADKVESRIQPLRDDLCDSAEMILCLQRHACCSIRCRKLIEKYIDCVDTMRVNMIKEFIECRDEQKDKEQPSKHS